MELVKESITIDKKIGCETTQLLLEGDIIVPDVKPDIDRILQTDARIIFNSTEISADRLNFSGKLDINILYLAKGSEKPIHNINSQIAIEDFMNLEGLTKDMWAELGGEITNIDYKLLNERKINVRAIAETTVSAASKDKHEVVVNINSIPETQLKKNILKLNRIVDSKEERFIIKDELMIPSGKPNIVEILQCAVCIANKEVKILSDKVSVSGDLIISTLYKGDSDQSFIEFVEHEIPFNGSIEALGAADGMFCDISLCINDKYFGVRQDSDGEDRVLDMEVSVSAKIKVNCEEETEFLEDAYCINKTLDLHKQDVSYHSLVCRNKNQCAVKEVIYMDKDCPVILQIFRVTGKPHIDDIKIIDDKVIVEGIIHADILYVAESDEIPLYCHNTIIPYRQIIETKGAKQSMNAAVDVCIDHIGFNMLAGDEVEVRCVLNFNTYVTEEKHIEVINEIEFFDIDKNILDSVASMTVYVVQPNDTLWKIAKRYNTSIEELVFVNNIENPDLIYPGQKLLIIKKIVEAC